MYFYSQLSSAPPWVWSSKYVELLEAIIRFVVFPIQLSIFVSQITCKFIRDPARSLHLKSSSMDQNIIDSYGMLSRQKPLTVAIQILPARLGPAAGRSIS